MNNKTAESKKFIQNEKEIGSKESLDSNFEIPELAEQSFSAIDQAQEQALKENNDIASQIDDQEIAKLCAQTELEIKDAADLSEGKLMKIFNSLVDKADAKWDKFKTNRNYNKLYNKLSEMRHEAYSLKKAGYKELEEKGKSKKLDNYFTGFEKRLAKCNISYQELHKEQLDAHNLRVLNGRIEDEFDELINYKLDNSKLEEAIVLWHDCPSKPIDPSRIARRMKDAFMIESGLSGSYTYNRAAYRETASMLKTRLADSPDLLLLTLGSGGGCSTERTENRKNNEFLEPLKKVIADPEKHYALNSIDLSDDILRRDLTPEIIEVTFKEYFKNNKGLIKNHLELFQGEVEKLSKDDRKNLFDSVFIYQDDLSKYGSFINLTPEEFDYCLSLFSGNPEKQDRIDVLVSTAESSSNRLALLTNAENIGLTVTQQQEILGHLETRSRVVEYAQLLAYPEKYPALSSEVIKDSFANFLKNNNDSDTLSKIFYNNIQFEDSLKEEFINSCFTESWPSKAFDFLNYNRQYLSQKDKDQIEKIVVDKMAYNEYLNFNYVSELTKFNPENLEALIGKVKKINRDVFFQLFVTGGDDKQFLPEKYFGDLVNKMEGYADFGYYLNTAINNKNIDKERYEEIVNKVCEAWSLEKIVAGKILENNLEEEGRSKVLVRFLESDNIKDLKEVLAIVTSNRLTLLEADNVKLFSRVIAKVDEANIGLVTGVYANQFKDVLNFETDDELVNLFLKEKNIAVLGHFLLKNLSDETLQTVVSEIINSGDSASRMTLLKAFPKIIIDKNKPNEVEHINTEKVNELVDKIIAVGSGLELTELLTFGVPQMIAGSGFEDLSTEKISLVKEKIIISGDQEAIEMLFNIHRYNPGFLNLTQIEKTKISESLIKKDKTKQGNLLNLLRLNKDFGLSEEDIEALLINLSINKKDDFIESIENHIYEPFFKLSEDRLNKIITDFITSNEEYTLGFFSMYARTFNHIEQENKGLSTLLSQDQINLMIPQLVITRYASGAFLEDYLELNERREEISKNNKIDLFVLSDRQIKILIYRYIQDNNFSNISTVEAIFENYKDIFEEMMTDEIVVKNHFFPFFELMESFPEAINSIIAKNGKLILDKLKDDAISNKDNQNILKFFNLLNNIGSFEAEHLEGLTEILGTQTNERDQALEFAYIFDSITSNNNIKVIDELLGRNLSEKFVSFHNKYTISDKGKTILNLIATREYKKAIEKDKKVSLENIFDNIENTLDKYDQILALHNPADIPKGLQVSIGMEYEVTNKIAESYKNKTTNNYTTDVIKLSEIAGLGHGNDAVHEFATNPTDNPYLMLLEMKLIQDLDYIDFNFKSEDEGGYEGAASGYHLTIGGEQGIYLNNQANFLQNIILAADLGGVYSGQEVKSVGHGRGSIRDRGLGNNNVRVFNNLSNSVELRSFSIDKWEQFERTILTSYHGALAIQALEKYTTIRGFHEFKNFGENTPNNSTDFYELLQSKGLVSQEVEDDKTKEIIYQWSKVQLKMIKAIDDHNNNFIDNETYGYLDDEGVWVEVQDFTRGRDNKKSFNEIIKQVAPDDSLEDYFSNNLKINDTADFFSEISVDLANKLTRLNNLYLKGDDVNIKSMLSTTVENGYPTSAGSHDAENSIFDLSGQTRTGRYYIQGSSDKFLINQAQDLLLNFVTEMQKTLKKPASNTSAQNLAA